MLVSCVRDGSENPTADERQQASVYVSKELPKTAPGIILSDDGNDDGAAIIIDKFETGDLLYFSQLTSSSSPNFTDLDDEAHPLYVYRYNQKDANWSEGYNFEYTDNHSIFDWDMVASLGSVGNAFSLFAFYFPTNQEIEPKPSGSFRVEADQRGTTDPYDRSNFMKSDIMGAYHATSSLFTRLRFRLFHLMVYLKVTIYVPVYEDYDDNDSFSYSGFKEGALQDAFVMNAYTDFTIEWQANRSSDTEAPLTQATGGRRNITMYRHKSDEGQIIEDFNVEDYYTKEKFGTDRVRAYTFSVLFPSQQFNDNFLCFKLLAPNNETMKYYYFSSSQIIDGADNSRYGLTQGTLQELHLYLPRLTNETVLVGANILPWFDANTDMTVTKPQTDE